MGYRTLHLSCCRADVSCGLFVRRPHATLISIIFPLASLILGRWTSKTPSWKIVLTLFTSTSAGRVRLRAKIPAHRSRLPVRFLARLPLFLPLAPDVQDPVIHCDLDVPLL